MTAARDTALMEAVARLSSAFRANRVVLFGSQARGTADERSDFDLLVVCQVSGNRRELALSMDRALRGLELTVDLVILSPEEYERDRSIPGTIARYASLEGRRLDAVA